MTRILRILATAGAVCSFAATAQAFTTGTYIDNFSGNDECPGPGGGKTAVPALSGSFCIAKFNLADDASGEQGNNSALDGLNLLDNFTLTGAGTPSGTFAFDDQFEGITITHLILKAGNEFSVYDLGGAVSGDWMTGPYLVNGQGAARNISHLSFFGTATSIPLPSSLLLLLGAVAGAGLVARRRTTA